MALAKAVQNSRKPPQIITWRDEDGDPVVLSGATLTGKKRREATGDVTAIDGSLVISNAEAGEFTWTYGATDVATAGVFHVQFTADYNGEKERSLLERWVVVEVL